MDGMEAAEYDNAAQESLQVLRDDGSKQKIDVPTAEVIQEIVGCLKIKTSTLAAGACERTRRIARVYPDEIINSPILPELANIVKDGPGTTLGNAALTALAAIALSPEGRQRICLLGVIPPIIRLVSKCDLGKSSTEHAAVLLSNLSADKVNRRIVAEAAGVEALVKLLQSQPGGMLIEYTLGALLNLMMEDNDCKWRFAQAGGLESLVRLLGPVSLPPRTREEVVTLRCKMLVAELSKVPQIEDKLLDIALEYDVKLA